MKRDRRVKEKQIECVEIEPAVAVIDRVKCTIEFRDRGTFLRTLRMLASDNVELYE